MLLFLNDPMYCHFPLRRILCARQPPQKSVTLPQIHLYGYCMSFHDGIHSTPSYLDCHGRPCNNMAFGQAAGASSTRHNDGRIIPNCTTIFVGTDSIGEGSQLWSSNRSYGCVCLHMFSNILRIFEDMSSSLVYPPTRGIADWNNAAW